jgi:hypothetical protein
MATTVTYAYAPERDYLLELLTTTDSLATEFKLAVEALGAIHIEFVNDILRTLTTNPEYQRAFVLLAMQRSAEYMQRIFPPGHRYEEVRRDEFMRFGNAAFVDLTHATTRGDRKIYENVSHFVHEMRKAWCTGVVTKAQPPS